MDRCTTELKSKGLKITPQRSAIYDLLLASKNHPTVEYIYSKVIKNYPTISLATVYKTVDILKDKGLLQEINVGEDKFRYDATVEPHPHFICRECGEVTDLSPVNLEKIKTDAQANYGVFIESEQLFFYGLCKDCKDIVANKERLA